MKSKIISFVMAILFIIVFGIFIYPGIYKYDKLNQNIPVKINRFTGSTQILTVNGWKSVTVPIVDNVSEPTDKGTSSESSSGYYTSKDFDNASNSDSDIMLGDISKIKILGSVSDNSYFYKINCTLKNEDTLDNNVYVEATLYDKNKNPINIINSSTNYINAGESIAINLSTDDYNMTSKYKSYELKVIQDKNIGFAERRKKELGIK